MLLQTHIDRDDDVAVSVVGIQDIHRDFLADMELGAQLRLQALNVLGGHQAILLDAQIYDDLVVANLLDGASPDLPAFERREVG